MRIDDLRQPTSVGWDTRIPHCAAQFSDICTALGSALPSHRLRSLAGSVAPGLAAAFMRKSRNADRRRSVAMAKVRVGMVGSGFAAELHMHGYKRVHGIEAEVAAVAARGDQ